MAEPAQTIKRLIVTGCVQGVGFRQFMSRRAHEFNVTGWARNLRDGSVEALLAGTPEAVHAMIERARRGPPNAVVSEIRITEGSGDFERFDILPTL